VGRSTEKVKDIKMVEVQKRSNWCVPIKTVYSVYHQIGTFYQIVTLFGDFYLRSNRYDFFGSILRFDFWSEFWPNIESMFIDTKKTPFEVALSCSTQKKFYLKNDKKLQGIPYNSRLSRKTSLIAVSQEQKFLSNSRFSIFHKILTLF